MTKDLEIDAPLEFLNKVEATGLPCHWNGEVLIVTVDMDAPQDLVKLATALQDAKKVVYRCVGIDGIPVPDNKTLKAIAETLIEEKRRKELKP